MSNIKINNTRKLSLKLRGDEYWDMMLFKDEAYGVDFNALSEDGPCLAAFVSSEESACTEYFENGKVYSKTSWINAVNSGDDEYSGVTLVNIGFTGIDNGLIYYDKDLISNIDFFNIYTNSHFCTLGETRLNLSAVKSNTGEHWFPIHLVDDGEKYFELKGGFLQGFFKTYGYDYQTLPDYISGSWTMNFVIRRRDEYEIDEHTLNYEHPENNGMFFYMGTRAENKFWEMFATDEEKENMKNFFIKDGYADVQLDVKDPNKDNSYYEFDVDYTVQSNDNCPVTNSWLSPGVIKLDFDMADEDDYQSIACACNFDNGVSKDYYNPLKCGDPSNPWVEAGYFVKDIDLDDVNIITSGGYDLDKNTDSYFEITSNNKYLIFNQTCSGYTVSKWEEEDGENKKFIFVAQRRKTPNYYLLFNQTCTGYTVSNIDDYYDENAESYDIYADIYRNAFGLKVNEDGSISYRYAIKNCGSGTTYYDYPGWIIDDKIKVIEEKTSPGLVKNGEWTDITVRFAILNNDIYDKCSNKIGRRLMRLYIYVGGYLKFISKILPEFNFRRLNDIPDKQEAVPYNISLGGGTQGLADTVTLDFMKHTDYTLPIEKIFGGSFMGDLKSYKFFNCPLNFPTIKAINL